MRGVQESSRALEGRKLMIFGGRWGGKLGLSEQSTRSNQRAIRAWVQAFVEQQDIPNTNNWRKASKRSFLKSLVILCVLMSASR